MELRFTKEEFELIRKGYLFMVNNQLTYGHSYDIYIDNILSGRTTKAQRICSYNAKDLFQIKSFDFKCIWRISKKELKEKMVDSWKPTYYFYEINEIFWFKTLRKETIKLPSWFDKDGE